MIGYSFDAVCGDEYILVDLDTKKEYVDYKIPAEVLRKDIVDVRLDIDRKIIVAYCRGEK